jgi:hypothetical protein
MEADALRAQLRDKEKELEKAKAALVKSLLEFIWGSVKFVFSMVVAFFSMLYQGYILSKIWLWFAVPFLKVPEVSTVEAAGLVCLWAIFKGVKTSDIRDIEKMSSKEKWGTWFAVIIWESTILWFANILRHHL